MDVLWQPSFLALPVYAVAVPVLKRVYGNSASTASFWKPLMLIYNLGMVFFSLWCCVGMIMAVQRVPLFSQDCSVAFRDPSFRRIVWAFFMSKFVEFADTLFLIVKGKNVSWLHYLHHLGAALNMGMLYGAEDEGVWLFVMLNGFVHTFMYAYYTATLMGVKLPWKRFLTMGQLIQFFLGFGMYWQYRGIKQCHRGPRLVTFWYTYGYVGLLVCLFANFYAKSYLKKRSGAKTHKAN